MFNILREDIEREHIPANLITDLLVETQLDRLFAEEEEYPVREVLGIMDLGTSRGRVAYPTTVYQTSGDDTSGIAGIIYPSGEFVAVEPPRKTQRFWEFDETLTYEKVEGELNEAGLPRVRGNSWTSGEVVWDGSVGGSIDTLAEDGDGNGPVNVRVYDATIMGDWPENKGELWKAIGRGTAMI